MLLLKRLAMALVAWLSISDRGTPEKSRPIRAMRLFVAADGRN